MFLKLIPEIKEKCLYRLEGGIKMKNKEKNWKVVKYES